MDPFSLFVSILCMSTLYNPLLLFVLVSEAAAGSLSRYFHSFLVLLSAQASLNWQFSFVSIFFADVVFAALVTSLFPALERLRLAYAGTAFAGIALAGTIFSIQSLVSLYSSKLAQK